MPICSNHRVFIDLCFIWGLAVSQMALMPLVENCCIILDKRKNDSTYNFINFENILQMELCNE